MNVKLFLTLLIETILYHFRNQNADWVNSYLQHEKWTVFKYEFPIRAILISPNSTFCVSFGSKGSTYYCANFECFSSKLLQNCLRRICCYLTLQFCLNDTTLRTTNSDRISSKSVFLFFTNWSSPCIYSQVSP